MSLVFSKLPDPSSSDALSATANDPAVALDLSGLPFSKHDQPIRDGGRLDLLVTLDLSAAPSGVAVSITAPAATAHSGRKCLPGQIVQYAISWGGEDLSVFAASSQAVSYQLEVVP